MEYFDRSKRSTLEKLYKPDKSRKGGVDEDAIPVIDELNKKNDYYTTSSCGGRISLFCEAPSGKKHDSYWILVKHGKVDFMEVKDALANLPGETVWFRQETPIFHVACRNTLAANSLLDVCRALGFKRAGIIGGEKRVMVEIIFNDKMDVPVSSAGNVFVDDKFLRFLVGKANDKFSKNQKLLRKFLKEIRKIK